MKLCSVRNLEDFVKQTYDGDTVNLVFTGCDGKKFTETISKGDSITMLSCCNYKAASGNCWAYKFDGVKFHPIPVQASKMEEVLRLIKN